MLLALMVAAKAATTKSSASWLILVYIAIFGAFYYFYIRPRSKRQKAARQETRKVEVGDRAQTIGGIVGTVIRMDRDLVTLKGDSGVEIDFIPSAIARKIVPPVPESTDDDDHSTEGETP